MSTIKIEKNYGNAQRIKPDPEKIIIGILNRIPDKLATKIKTVSIIYSNKTTPTRIKSYPIDKRKECYKIEVDMASLDYTNIPFFSIMVINIDFIAVLVAIYKNNETQPLKDGYRYDWMYFGIWQPVNSILKLYHHLKKKNRMLSKLNKLINKLLLKIAGVE